MMRRIIENSSRHSLKNKKILQTNEFSYAACSQGKLIIRPSPAKIGIESPIFLKRIHDDIYGPIKPSSGPFKYFMVLIDASTRWSHICLLSTRNLAFVRPLLMRAKLPISTWGHAILHVAALIRIRSISYHEFSPLQLVHGQEPNISHLRIFGCVVYIPITPPHRTKMGPQRRL